MTTLMIDVPDDAFFALRRSPPELALEMRIAAAVQWYAEQVVSQEKAAAIAGLTRVEFLDELKRRRVSAFQETLDDLVREIESDMTDSDRITMDAQVCGGRPCIRGMRIRVKDVLDMLAGGASREEILDDYPYLEDADITAALEYAAEQADHVTLRVA
jgi:uncharacterized protein (DUF433 family)/predicted HTH domain antitoxin